jgi:Na+-driven multidrug efflux pump
MLFLGTVGALFVAFAGPIVSVFTRDPAVAPIAEMCLRTISYGFLFYAYGMVITQSFNGAGDTWTPTWINLGCFWLWEIPLAYQLARHGGLGPRGVALAVTIAFSTVAVVSAVIFRRGRWKERRV